jgi:hypothetical protein
MDAATVGLIGTLGGVGLGGTLGAGVQALQAKRSRRWQVEDQVKSQAAQRQDTLRQDRGAAYAELMVAMVDVIDSYHRAWSLDASNAQEGSEPPESTPGRAAEAKDATYTSLNIAKRKCEVARLISGSVEVRNAASAFITTMLPLSPALAHRGSPYSQTITNALASAYDRFSEAARIDLEIKDNELKTTE